MAVTRPVLTLDEQHLPVADRAHDLVLLDGALTELESLSERPARWLSCASLAGSRSKRPQP